MIENERNALSSSSHRIFVSVHLLDVDGLATRGCREAKLV